MDEMEIVEAAQNVEDHISEISQGYGCFWGDEDEEEGNDETDF